jgi:hypothetical protein
MGCGPEGRVGLALRRSTGRQANEVFFSLRRGDVVAVEGTEPRGDGLALVEGSSVRKVASAGSPSRLRAARGEPGLVGGQPVVFRRTVEGV